MLRDLKFSLEQHTHAWLFKVNSQANERTWFVLDKAADHIFQELLEYSAKTCT